MRKTASASKAANYLILQTMIGHASACPIIVLNGIEMCRSLLFDNSDVAAKRLLQIRSMSDGAAPGTKSFSIIGNLSIDM